MTGFMVSLLIGFSKRFAEMQSHEAPAHHRAVLQYYSVDTLRAFVIVMAAATIMTYALYTLSPRSVAIHGHTRLVYTIPIVVFGVFRFLHLVFHSHTGEDPANEILRDRQLLLTILLWLVAYGFVNL